MDCGASASLHRLHVDVPLIPPCESSDFSRVLFSDLVAHLLHLPSYSSVHNDALLAEIVIRMSGRTDHRRTVSQVAVAILSYLHEHPEAKDSAKGIAQWWVSEDLPLVEEALELLRKEKAVEKRGDVYSLGRNANQ